MEIWKDINGYEGYYKVSNLGIIKSLDRIIVTKNGFNKNIKGKIMSNVYDGNKNYLMITLSKLSKSKMYLVHRLVAREFCCGYNKAKDVDHINGIKNDNRSYNLRWVTRSENMLNPITHKKILNHHKEIQNKEVIGINSKNGLIITFESSREAQRNGFKGVRENISGRSKICKGYRWRYLNNVI